MRKIKEAVLSILLLMLAVTGLFAINNQKIYPVDSPLYENIRTLSLISGTALPSASGPWSEDELLMMLSNIRRDSLPESARLLFDETNEALLASSSIFCNNFALAWSIDHNTELYLHSNIKEDEFIGQEGRFSFYNEYHPLLTIGLEVWPTSHFYSYSELSLGNYTITAEPFGANYLSTNVFGFQNPIKPKFSEINMTFPYRAFVAAGGNSWSLQLGRDRLNWGHGVSGNLFIGDNFPYHNMIRFTTYFDSFKYSFVSSFFPHPKTYQAVRDDSGAITTAWGEGGSQSNPVSGLYMLMAHRVEFRPSPSLRFAVSEAIMYQAEDNTLDLQIFNPVMIFHDYYIKSNANSLLGVSADYTFSKGFAAYGEVILDEFALPTLNAAPGETGNPNAFGFLFGFRGAVPTGEGIVKLSAETVFTEPDLYLRSKSDENQIKGEYGINYIAAVKKFSEVKTVYDEEFIGYRYGGDAICFNLALGYQKPAAFEVAGNLFYMIHGTYDKWTCWTKKSVNTFPLPPTTAHPQDNHVDDNASLRDSAEHTIVLSLSSNTRIMPQFDMRVGTQLDFVGIINPGNLKANTPIFDAQLTLFIKVSYI